MLRVSSRQRLVSWDAFDASAPEEEEEQQQQSTSPPPLDANGNGIDSYDDDFDDDDSLADYESCCGNEPSPSSRRGSASALPPPPPSPGSASAGGWSFDLTAASDDEDEGASLIPSLRAAVAISRGEKVPPTPSPPPPPPPAAAPTAAPTAASSRKRDREDGVAGSTAKVGTAAPSVIPTTPTTGGGGMKKTVSFSALADVVVALPSPAPVSPLRPVPSDASLRRYLSVGSCLCDVADDDTDAEPEPTLPTLIDDLIRNVASFLPVPSVRSLSATCRPLRSALVGDADCVAGLWLELSGREWDVVRSLAAGGGRRRVELRDRLGVPVGVPVAGGASGGDGRGGDGRAAAVNASALLGLSALNHPTSVVVPTARLPTRDPRLASRLNNNNFPGILPRDPPPRPPGAEFRTYDAAVPAAGGPPSGAASAAADGGGDGAAAAEAARKNENTVARRSRRVPVVQYVGSVGDGDRSVVSDRPLPRPLLRRVVSGAPSGSAAVPVPPSDGDFPAVEGYIGVGCVPRLKRWSPRLSPLVPPVDMSPLGPLGVGPGVSLMELLRRRKSSFSSSPSSSFGGSNHSSEGNKDGTKVRLPFVSPYVVSDRAGGAEEGGKGESSSAGEDGGTVVVDVTPRLVSYYEVTILPRDGRQEAEAEAEAMAEAAPFRRRTADAAAAAGTARRGRRSTTFGDAGTDEEDGDGNDDDNRRVVGGGPAMPPLHLTPAAVGGGRNAAAAAAAAAATGRLHLPDPRNLPHPRSNNGNGNGNGNGGSNAPPDCVAVGLSTSNFRSSAKMPGWDSHSFGYHGDDGGTFHGAGDMERVFGPRFGTGDTVGCGVDYSTSSSSGEEGGGGGGIFFTLNGTFLGYAWTGEALAAMQAEERGGDDWREVDLYPTVGVDTNCPIAVNFGAAPFAFDLGGRFGSDRHGEEVAEALGTLLPNRTGGGPARPAPTIGSAGGSRRRGRHQQPGSSGGPSSLTLDYSGGTDGWEWGGDDAPRSFVNPPHPWHGAVGPRVGGGPRMVLR